MPSDYAIETAGLTKIYRSRWTGREVRAVDDISLRIARGTIFGLLGPNGAGKTTFVKLLLSATHPSAGSALLFGRDARVPEARRPIGYLPENHRFPTYFTGEGMLDFYAALSGLDAQQRKKLIPELLELVGLAQWGSVRLGKYSKGMLQRVGLAQALIHSPSLLILDEPTDGVDPVGRRHIRDILTRCEEKGVTIFINSHLLVEVELFCREVAILHQGKVAVSGKVTDLIAGKGYRLTISQAPQNLLEQLRSQATSMAARNGLVDFQFPSRELANQALDLVRAEHCEVEALAPTTSTLEDVFVRTVENGAK
ncbi:MAG TPA: ABC transporter ATP-binding protein [Bryobacteraceae bacterium]|nr:ABC transporter ATP-binding protein [Bryobacteraceae bacterium]